MLSFALLVMFAIVLNYDRSTALQNTQKDCRQCLSHSFRVHQIRFRPGLRSAPDHAEGAYSTPPDLLAGLRGPTSKGKGKGQEGREEEGTVP